VDTFWSDYGPPAISSQQENESCGLREGWDFLITWTFRKGQCPITLVTRTNV